MLFHPGSHTMIKKAIGGLALLCMTCVWGVAGCQKTAPPPPRQNPYRDLGLRSLPPILKNTVMERCDLANVDPLAVTSYGLVVNLRYSGDSRAPTPVREWMIKEMYRHGMGNLRIPGYREMTPERVLADKRTAITMVGAYLPPGARKDQRVDVIVQALPGSDTASLSGGTLYQCDLRLMGANPLNPGGSVNKYIEARGQLFINPAYALETPKPTEGPARFGARTATVLGGGRVTADRPIHLRMRTPQWNITRAVEAQINQRFQAVADKPRQDGKGLCVAEAQDEGYLHLYVPVVYQGNWEHFVAVVNRLYMNITPALAAVKAQELTNEATRPNALLEDISYALEGLGPVAVPYIAPLLSNPSPDVQYAAARAGAYLRDTNSENTLMRIAGTVGHPFRVNAINILGELPFNSEIARALVPCLESDESLVRIAAYKVLSAHDDPRIPTSITSIQVRESFVIDLIESKNAPSMIYANRVGSPRIAFFGSKIPINKDLTFAAFDTELTIASNPQKANQLSIFYRGDEYQAPVVTQSRPIAPELAARLGGAGEEKLRFGYGEIVAILQKLCVSHNVPAAFVLQDVAGVDETFIATGQNSSRPVGEAAPSTTGTAPVSNQHPDGNPSPGGRAN